MENLKIRVNSEDESKEIQINLEQLGFKKFIWGIFVHNSYFIFANRNYYSRDNIENFSECDYKEITLPELRDLVVLKRNDVGDATHEDKNDPEFKYRLIDNHWYVITEGNPAWRKDSIDLNEAPLFIKPIEKPMKEYLRKNSNGTYSYIGTVRPEHVSDFMIEIPKGATAARLCDDVEFYKNDFGMFFSLTSGNWLNTISPRGVLMKNILWQRAQHPEELPFIDDEPSLNDQYAEIEKVRQDIINSPGHYADSTIECIDAMQAMMTPEQFIGYLRGNVFKYQWRYEKKNGIEDLKKAQWYLDKLVSKVNEKHSFF